MRANNVYIIHHSPLTDADPFKGGLFGRTCVSLPSKHKPTKQNAVLFVGEGGIAPPYSPISPDRGLKPSTYTGRQALFLFLIFDSAHNEFNNFSLRTLID
jgi:hypothetical protein